MDFSDKTSYSINTKAMTLIVAGILVLVNILSLRYFVRFDLTESKQYSISDSTENILAGLEDIVTVKAYFTENLPPQFLPIDRYVRDILAEYEAYGSGNFSYEFVDPERKIEAAQEAQRIGVQQVRMQVRENDSFSVKNGYLGLGIFFEGKTEAIPVIQESDLSNIEYDLTSLIVKLTQPREMVVGFLQGHDEHSMNSSPYGAQQEGADYTGVSQVLSRNYDVKSINFARGDTLEGVDALIAAGAKRDLSDRDIFEIDQYLLKGGKAIFLIDSVSQVAGGIDVQPMENNVKNLFVPMGVTVDTNVLLDSLSELTNFQEGPGQFFFLQYPPFIRLVSDNFTSFPVVAKIQSFVVRFVSSLTFTEDENLNYDKFANTSPSSWSQEGSFNLAPTAIQQPAQDQLSSRTVGVSITGMMPRISDKDLVPALQEWIKDDKSGEYALKNVEKDENKKNREIVKEAQAEANVIIFADSDFIADPYIRNDQTSLVVFQNMVDYLVFGD